MRGYIYTSLKVFHNTSSRNIYLERGLRIKNGQSIKLEKGVGFGINSRLEVFHTKQYPNLSTPKITIGYKTTFGDMFHCGAINKITIGNNVLGGSKILITDHSHGSTKDELKKDKVCSPVSRELFSKGCVTIHDNVWIGDGVVILPGTTIEEGVVISANSVVRGHIPAKSIYYTSK